MDSAPLREEAWPQFEALDEALLALETARTPGKRDFSPYADRPVAFIEDVLRVKNLWAKQREIIDALETHDRVVVYGAVNTGKDYLSAAAAMHAAYARGQMVLMTSATLRQVTKIGMRDLGRFKQAAHLPGKLQKLSLEAPGSGGILGLTGTEGSKLSGHHWPAGVFIVISEAQAFDDEEQLAGLLSCASSAGSKILAVGNPLLNSGWFPRIAQPDTTLDRVIEDGGTFHVVRLTGVSAARDRTFEEAERTVRVKLVEERLRAAEADLDRALRERFPVQIDEAALAKVAVPSGTNEKPR